jgi:hypothetical protein
MKLEIPAAKIMKGELAQLSPPACKLLLCILGTQQDAHAISTWSKQSLSRISGLSERTIYRLLPELEEKNWITRKGTTICISDLAVTMPRVGSYPDSAMSVSKMADRLPLLSGSHPDKALSDDPDQRDLKQEDMIKFQDLNNFIELYKLKNGEVDYLWQLVKPYPKNKILSIFTTMQNHEIGKPISYLKKCLNNNGKQLLDIFMDSIHA